MNDNTCVCCGAIIPEGRQVCWICERGEDMRLIDADEAKKALTGWENDATDEEIEYTIDELPTVDAEPVKHGKWVFGKELGFEAKTIVYCSNCKREAYYSEYGAEKFAFCPYCGAKMDEN